MGDIIIRVVVGVGDGDVVVAGTGEEIENDDGILIYVALEDSNLLLVVVGVHGVVGLVVVNLVGDEVCRSLLALCCTLVRSIFSCVRVFSLSLVILLLVVVVVVFVLVDGVAGDVDDDDVVGEDVDTTSIISSNGSSSS